MKHVALCVLLLAHAALLPPARAQSVQPAQNRPRPAFVAVRDGEQSICCLPGDVLRLAGHFAADRPLIMRYLDTGDTWQFKADITGKSDDYSYDWTAPKPGTYHLNAGYTSADARQFSARACTVSVFAAPPVTLDLPPSAVSDVSVTARETDPSAFHADSITVQCDGREAHVTGMQATLPLASLPSGSYAVTFVATDRQKGRFVGGAGAVRVPERVEVTAPAAVTLANATDTVPLGVVLLPGVTVSKVTYFCDGRTVAAADHAPFAGAANLSAFASGSHALEAAADAPGGISYRSVPVSVTLVNPPLDKANAAAAAALAAQKAQNRADADARAARQAAQKTQAAKDAHAAAELKANLKSGFRPRIGYDEALFRQQIMAYAYNPMQPRTGKVGVVKGLSVLFADDKPQFGMPLVVEAIVRPGTGQTNFLAFSEDDSRIAAQTAAENCKARTGQMGSKWDWTKYDLTISYQENEFKHGGPSAGVADTVALMSAVTNLPVDSGVAVTGAISLHGDVLPVGGVAFKADAALSDPDVRVLILPDHIASTEDLQEVYKLEPEVFFNKHIILAKNLDTVLRYALIGWDAPTYNRAKGLTQEAIRQFGKGQDAESLRLFEMAKALTPEDIGIGYWISLVKAVDAMKPVRD